MATFATPADVRACFRNMGTLPTNSEVNDTKIQAWLDAIEVRVMGKIYTLYASAITSAVNPLSVKLIAQIETFFAAAIVDDILNTYSDGQKKPTWEKRAIEMLNELIPPRDKDGRQPEPLTKLPDATYLGTTTVTGQLSVKNITTGPRFKKGENNW